MLRLSKSSFFLVILLALSALSFTPRGMGAPESIQPFYADPAYLSEGKVFRFADQKNEGNYEYIWRKTEQDGSDWILISRPFDNEFKPKGEMQEKLHSKGADLLAMNFHMNGQKIETNVEKSSSMKWALKELKKVSWQVGFSGDGGEETLRSDRLYHGFDKARELEGEMRQVIKFTDYFVVKGMEDGEEKEEMFYQYVYFAQGLGMIEFERNEGGKWTDHFVMDKVMSLSEWEALQK